MSIRVYEITAAGAVHGYFSQVCKKMVQRRRIVRYCISRSIDCVPTSIICNNYQRDLEKACMLYRMGYADAVIIAGKGEWSESEKALFDKLTAASKAKIINLDDLDCRYLID